MKDIRFSVSAEQRPGFKPALPVSVADDVIDSANGCELPSLQDFADTTSSCDGQARRTKRVKPHVLSVKEDVIANKQRFLEDVKGKTRSMAIDMKGFDAVVHEVFPEGAVEAEGAADLVGRIVLMNSNFGSKEFPVEVRSAEKVMVGEKNRVRPFQRGIQRGGTIDPAGTMAGLDTVGGMLDPKGRVRI